MRAWMLSCWPWESPTKRLSPEAGFLRKARAAFGGLQMTSLGASSSCVEPRPCGAVSGCRSVGSSTAYGGAPRIGGNPLLKGIDEATPGRAESPRAQSLVDFRLRQEPLWRDPPRQACARPAPGRRQESRPPHRRPHGRARLPEDVPLPGRSLNPGSQTHCRRRRCPTTAWSVRPKY